MNSDSLKCYFRENEWTQLTFIWGFPLGTGINLQQILKAIEAKSPEVWGPRKSMTMTNLQRMRFASVESKGEEHLLAIIYIY